MIGLTLILIAVVLYVVIAAASALIRRLKDKASRPVGSTEFGTLMVIALFAAPLAVHLVAIYAA